MVYRICILKNQQPQKPIVYISCLHRTCSTCISLAHKVVREEGSSKYCQLHTSHNLHPGAVIDDKVAVGKVVIWMTGQPQCSGQRTDRVLSPCATEKFGLAARL